MVEFAYFARLKDSLGGHFEGRITPAIVSENHFAYIFQSTLGAKPTLHWRVSGFVGRARIQKRVTSFCRYPTTLPLFHASNTDNLLFKLQLYCKKCLSSCL